MNNSLEEKVSYLLGLAKERNAHGDRKGVVMYLDEIISIDPLNKLMYQLRGNEFYNLKQYDLSIRDFKTALTFDSENDEYYLCLGAAKRQSGDIKGAFWDYLQGLEFNPNNANLWFNIGNIRRLGNDFVGAKECFENVVRLNENDIESKNWILACSRFHNEDPLESYINTLPFNCDEIMDIALDFEKKNDFKSSLAFCMRAVELYPELPHLLTYLKRLEIKLGINVA